jgi:hypothetical protein
MIEAEDQNWDAENAKVLAEEFKGTFIMEERPYTPRPRREPIGYEADEVRRMGARCLLRDVPTKRQLIEHDWRFDHTISQFVVYL